MNNEMFVVIVDTRGMSPSDIDGYEECTYTEEYFDHHVLEPRRNFNFRKGHEVKCIKSKVAELCGLNLKIYFNEYCEIHSQKFQNGELKKAMSQEEEELDHTNGAATLLTFDPRTGYPEYKVLGKAYVVVDSGDYPVSNHQVWGLCDLISEARDFYHCDPDHIYSGRRQLLRFCHDYQHENWGPLTIYEPRLIKDKGHPHEFPHHDQKFVTEDYYRHRHDKPKQAYVLKNETAVIHEEPIEMKHERRAKATRFPFGRLHFSSKPLDFDEDEYRDDRNTHVDDHDDDNNSQSNSVPSILATTKCYHYRI